MANNVGGDNSLDETFVYDANGNLTYRSKGNYSFTYPAQTAARPHTPTHLNGVPLSHDANGNMASDGGRTFTFDGANRLSRVVRTQSADDHSCEFCRRRVPVFSKRS